MIDYKPPTDAHMRHLKQQLGYTGEQMAQLVSVHGGQQWRKYTGGAEPRAVNMHMLFFMAARLSLSPQALRLVGDKMRELGAQINPDELAQLPKSNAD